MGGELSPSRLIDAYRRGIFPWFSEDQPVLWWSPDPRLVLAIEDFRLSHSLKKKVLALSRPDAQVQVYCDTRFEDVMKACAAPRAGQSGTWISTAIIDAYLALHEIGCAHSVETFVEGELVGGLYGVCLGKMFYGESMFTRQADASKIALACLVNWLRGQGFPMIDCQQQTSHLASLGARPIKREIFAERVSKLVEEAAPRAWPERFFWES